MNIYCVPQLLHTSISIALSIIPRKSFNLLQAIIVCVFFDSQSLDQLITELNCIGLRPANLHSLTPTLSLSPCSVHLPLSIGARSSVARQHFKLVSLARSTHNSVMSKRVILIGGATSRNGSEAARLLLQTGKCEVRLGARDPSSAKLSALSAQGAQPVLLDSTLESAVAAFRGVHSVYIILPTLVSADTERSLLENYLEAAKTAHVKHIVYLSAIDVASPTADFKTVHEHYEHEQQVIKSGIDYTILRPTWFHENIINYHGASIKKDGVFRTSAGDGVYTSVAICDMAAVAAKALIEYPSKHVGQVYILTTEAVTEKQLAEKLSKATGKQVKHINYTPEEHEAALKQVFAGSANGPERAAGLVLLDKNKRESRFGVVDPALERVLGRKGLSIDEFLSEHASEFKLNSNIE